MKKKRISVFVIDMGAKEKMDNINITSYLYNVEGEGLNKKKREIYNQQCVCKVETREIKKKSVETTKGVIENGGEEGGKRETEPLDSNPVTVDFGFSFPTRNENGSIYTRKQGCNKIRAKRMQEEEWTAREECRLPVKWWLVVGSLSAPYWRRNGYDHRHCTTEVEA